MNSRHVNLIRVLKGGAIVAFCVAVGRAPTGSAVSAALGRSSAAAHAQSTTHHDRRHMHVRNWLLEPTGRPGVSPLDPLSIPKYMNELTKPPVFIPDGVGRDRELHYTVTYKPIQQQLLPPGFPSTEVYAYGGTANFNEPGERPDIHTTFSTPGPTFEAQRNQRIRVHYVNQIDGPHIFPVDPTIMFANPNNQPAPTPPFLPFPPGYRFAQSPVPVVTHLHGGYTPSDSDGFVTAWFTKDELKKGPDFKSSTFEYFNGQPRRRCGTTITRSARRG